MREGEFCFLLSEDDGQSVTLEDYINLVKDEMGISLKISEGLGRKK